MSGPTDGRPQGEGSADAIPGYQVLGVLGRGGMGVVYQARHLRLKRLVAVKMVLAGGHAGPDALARFRTEAEAIARLQHPNIVQVFEVGEHGALPFLSLEFCGGGSLAKKLAGTPLPPAGAAALVETLARAMQAAHAKGVVHRDLKPANVLLAEDGTPKVTDFGLAKKLDEAGQTVPGMVMGTPSYMAPEQAEGQEDVGPLADVYALGAILYECLTGRPPFKAATSGDTILQVISADPVPPRQLNAGVPRDLETICLKCLQKDPARRYASAAALADDLHRFLANVPILARPTTTGERFTKWRRRNPRVALLSGFIALVVVAWAVTATWLSLSLHDQVGRTNEALAAAKTSEEAAKRNEATAKYNEVVAQQRQLAAMNNVLVLGQAWVATDLRNQRAQDGPVKSEALRRQVLAVARQELDQMDRSKLFSAFAETTHRQMVGDFARKIGLLREALAEYQQGYNVVKKITQEQPDNDKARANMAVMLLRLGNIAWEMNGDVGMARTCFERARDLRREIAEHPRSGDFTAENNRIALAYVALDLGRLEFAQGHLAAARDRVAEALEARRAWVKEGPAEDRVIAESYLSEACLSMGRVRAHQGDREGGEKHLQEALELSDRLATGDPNEPSYQVDLAEIYCGRGEALALRGEWEAAARSFEKSHQHLQVLAAEPEDVSRHALLARTHDGLAAAAEQKGKASEARAQRQESLKVWEELTQVEPASATAKAALALARAHVGQPAEEKAVAEVTSRAAGNCELLLQLARYHALRAAGAAAPNQRRAAAARALTLLDDGVKAGYADRVVLTGDPDLAPLRQEAGFQALLNRLPR
jgi:serine/threonine-protein kinase